MRGSIVNTDHPWVRLSDENISVYNAWDTYATARLAQALPETMAAHGQWEFYSHEIAPLIPAVMAMQGRGIPVDLGERTRIRRSLRAEVRAADTLICTLAGQPFVDAYERGDRKGWNPNSDTQLRRWLFGGDRTVAEPGAPIEVTKGLKLPCLGLKPAGKTETKLWSVDQDSLLRVLRDFRKKDEPHRPLLLALLHRSRFVKLDEYLEFTATDRGHGPRIYPTVKMHGTKSLRFAYADPALHSWAAEIRSVVAAPPGYAFVKGDFSQIEARLAAYIPGDALDIAVYEREGAAPYKHHPDWDIHSALVHQCFPDVRDRWQTMTNDERDLYRGHAKTVRYGTLMYGGAPETAKTKAFCPCGGGDWQPPWTRCKGMPPTLDLTTTRKRAIVDAWMARHTAFTAWRRELLKPFQGPHATHCLTNAMGWKRWFCTPYGPELEREIYAWAISSVASVIKLRALRRLHEAGVALLFDHHDALLALCPEAEVKATTALFHSTMSLPVPELGGVCFPVDVNHGHNWGDLH